MKGFTSVLIRGAGTALVIQGLGAGLRYLWQVLFARWMGPPEYGSFSFAFGWLEILGIVAALGLTTGALRFVSEYETRQEWGRLKGIVRRSRQLTLGAGLAVAALGTPLVLLLTPGELDRTALLVALWIVPLLALGNLHVEIIRATKDVLRAYLPMRVVQPAAAILLGLVLYRSQGTLTGVQGLGALAASVAITVLLQHLWLGRALPDEVSGTTAEFETRYWLRESFPLLLIAGFVILLKQTDVIMVGALMGAREVGIYAAAAVTARLVNFMLLSVNAIAAPLIASLHAQDDIETLQSMVSRTARWSFWASLAMAAGLVVAGEWVLQLFGSEYVAARNALWILAAGQVMNGSMGPVGHLMNLTGHGKKSAMVYGTAAGVNVTLDLLLIPWLGIEGAALATTSSMVLWNVWLYFQVRDNVGVRSFALVS